MVNTPPHVDAVVLGAGISGMVSASVLLAQGARSVVVVDSYDHVGGNHVDYSATFPEGDAYTFDIGSLIFQDDSPLLEHFPELLPYYLPIDPSWSRLNPQGHVTSYPFSVADDIVRAGPAEVARLLASAVVARLQRRPPTNAREFAEHWLGPRFVERSGLASYMERFCGVPVEQIDIEFAHSRMMWIAEHAAPANLLRRILAPLRRRPVPPPTNRQLARPFEGFATLYAPAVASLEARGVRFVLGADLVRLNSYDEGGGSRRFTLTTGDGSFTAPRAVSTVPLDVALKLTGRAGRCEPLPTVQLLSLFYSFEGRRGFDSSVLYNFSHEGSWKRLTVYSDLYGAAGSGREYLGVEVVSGRAGSEDGDLDQAAAAFRAHTAANGLLDGDLRFEGGHRLDHAYPIYTRGSGGRAAAAIAELREIGVESLGRQGAFQYQPTARHSTLEAEAALRPRATAPDRSASDPGTAPGTDRSIL